MEGLLEKAIALEKRPDGGSGFDYNAKLILFYGGGGLLY